MNLTRRLLLHIWPFLLLPECGQALEPLADESLSRVIGKDGISIGMSLPGSTLKFSQLSLVDDFGIAGGNHVDGADYTSPGAWVYAPKNYDANGAAQLFSDVNFLVPTSQPLTLKIDVGSGAAGASLNAELSMPSDMLGLRVNPFSLYVWNGPGSIYNTSRPTQQPGVTEVLRSGAINMLFGVSPTVNLQLATGGPQGSGHMLSFSGGTVSCISNADSLCGPILESNQDKISVLSENGSTTDSQISLDFLFDARTYGGFGLAGIYADTDSEGLLFGRTGTTTKFDVHLLNVELGTVDTATPDGLANGQAISRMGAEGVTITDLQTRIHGI